MPVSKFSISLQPDVVEQIASRAGEQGERSAVINKSLERYFAALRHARRDLADKLNQNELSLILDALNGVGVFDPGAANYIVMEVADAIRLNRLDEKWGVDGKVLNKKLAGLSYCEKLALVDMGERWWGKVGAGEDPDVADALR